MKKSILIESLKDFGLSEHEAGVYFAALSLGPTTVLKIAQTAGIKRTTVYSVVESLKHKGLMNIEMKGFKKLFVAEDPEKLESVLESRRNTFRNLLPEFSAMYNLGGGESLIKYYEGLESVKSLYESLLKEMRPHEDYLVISDETRWLEADQKYFMDFQRRRARLNINTRLILQDSTPARETKKLETQLNLKVKLLPPGINIANNFVIVPKKIVYHQLVPPIIAIVIENKSVIQTNREMFEIIWRSI